MAFNTKFPPTPRTEPVPVPKPSEAQNLNATLEFCDWLEIKLQAHLSRLEQGLYAAHSVNVCLFLYDKRENTWNQLQAVRRYRRRVEQRVFASCHEVDATEFTSGAPAHDGADDDNTPPVGCEGCNGPAN